MNFSRKVEAVLTKRVGTKSVVFNNTLGFNLTTDPALQDYGHCCLYGSAGSLDSNFWAGYRDIYRIMKNDPEIEHDVNGFPINGKICFKSAVIDLQFINRGTVPLEMDLYKIGFWRRGTDPSDWLQQFLNVLSATAPINSGGTNLALTQKGVTPFQAPAAIRATAMKVLMKKKYIVPSLGMATFQHRDARNYWVDCETVVNSDVYNEKFTTVYLWITKTFPNQTEAQGFNVTVTRTYEYVVINNNVPVDQLNP